MNKQKRADLLLVMVTFFWGASYYLTNLCLTDLQPMNLTASTGGFDWKDRGVRAEQVMKRNEITPQGSKTLWDYAYENFVKPNIEKGNLQS